MAEANKWLFSSEAIQNDALSLKDGTDRTPPDCLRFSCAIFLRTLGIELEAPPETIATSIVYCHRFFMLQSFSRNDKYLIASACMFIAAKDTYRLKSIRDVVTISHLIIYQNDPPAAERIRQKEFYRGQVELLVRAEHVIVSTLGRGLYVECPYKFLRIINKRFENADVDWLYQAARNFVNDSLLTTLFLQYEPRVIAAGGFMLASMLLDVVLEPSDWFEDYYVTGASLQDVCAQLLKFYEIRLGLRAESSSSPPNQITSEGVPRDGQNLGKFIGKSSDSDNRDASSAAGKQDVDADHCTVGRPSGHGLVPTIDQENAGKASNDLLKPKPTTANPPDEEKDRTKRMRRKRKSRWSTPPEINRGEAESEQARADDGRNDGPDNIQMSGVQHESLEEGEIPMEIDKSVPEMTNNTDRSEKAKGAPVDIQMNGDQPVRVENGEIPMQVEQSADHRHSAERSKSDSLEFSLGSSADNTSKKRQSDKVKQEKAMQRKARWKKFVESNRQWKKFVESNKD